ncbi:hypothetical protein [Bradyrhizobium diazoefficiens]
MRKIGEDVTETPRGPRRMDAAYMTQIAVRRAATRKVDRRLADISGDTSVTDRHSSGLSHFAIHQSLVFCQDQIHCVVLILQSAAAASKEYINRVPTHTTNKRMTFIESSHAYRALALPH